MHVLGVRKVGLKVQFPNPLVDNTSRIDSLCIIASWFIHIFLASKCTSRKGTLI